MRFSVCIPNYNYERYLGRTLRSVLDQTEPDLEVVIADNASTDASLSVIAGEPDPRVHVRRNACNVGFARNLDKAAQMAQGESMIMLSSDDLMHPDALRVYGRLLDAVDDAPDTVISSRCDVIDPDDAVIGGVGFDPLLWHASDRVPELDELAGGPVYRVAADELLGRSLRTMHNPFSFLTTCYPRSLYEAVEGYGGGRLINPDKWFNWRLLNRAQSAYFVDRPLFSYRWHPDNQSAAQLRTDALKYLADEYANTLEIDDAMLTRARLARGALIAAFVRHDVADHGLATLARGDRQRARRILTFGTACYPEVTRRDRHALALRGLLALGPIGARLAEAAHRRRDLSPPGQLVDR